MSQHLVKMVDEIQRFVRLSPKVINAMQSVDRAFFVPEIFLDKAYSLDALPIPYATRWGKCVRSRLWKWLSGDDSL